ncbi:MAG TPA: stage II sporulation protein M [Thermoanaerobaculia bacterium]|nr:stage II sporulation protein M [Thermoanaerobaculia bacterium]
MNIERFLNERRPVWDSLLRLLDRADDVELSRGEMTELVELYRRTCSDLNRARSYTANPEVLGHLNQLTGRAYRLIYRAAHETPIWATFVHLILREIPAAFRKQRTSVWLATLAFVAGALFGSIAVLIDPANGERLIPQMFFSESPKERVEKIESGEERIDNLEKAMLFGASLYTHNIQVAFLAFSLGALTLVMGFVILFYNGVILGAVGTMYVLDGVSVFFLAWVGPHGALELPSIIFGGAAGIVVGRALLLPGALSRGASLRRVLPSVWRMMLGTMLTLVCAGLIEGSFSQFSAKTIPYELKIFVAAMLFLGLIVYLFLRRVSGEGLE